MKERCRLILGSLVACHAPPRRRPLRRRRRYLVSMDFIKEKPLAQVATSKVLDSAPPATTGSRRLDNIGVDGIVVDGLLSAEECGRLVKVAEASTGFAFWDPDCSPERRAVRNADTLEFEDAELCTDLYSRLLPHIAKTVRFSPEDEDTFETELEGEWVATGLNTHLLINRYGGGGHFAPHADGSTVVDFNHRSLYVCRLRLKWRAGKPCPAGASSSCCCCHRSSSCYWRMLC